MTIKVLQNYTVGCTEAGLRKLEENRQKKESIFREIDAMEKSRRFAIIDDQSPEMTMKITSWDVGESTGRLTLEIEPRD